MSEAAVDFSFARIPASVLVKAGVKHVFRYLAYLPNGKVITPAEYADDRAHGITVHLNWETTAQRPMSGASGGVADGIEANHQASRLGAPTSGPAGTIIFSLDVDDRGLPSNWANVVEAYLRAARTQGRPVGIYGSYRVIEEMHRRRCADVFWQTAAWSGDYVSPVADYYQRTGHSWHITGVSDSAYDEDVVIHTGVTPQPAPKPVPAPVTHGGITVQVDAKSGLVSTTHYGFGLFMGVLDAGGPVDSCQATIHGPDPHSGDASSPDDWWGHTLNATVRAQVRGNHVVVTVSAPLWKPGSPTPLIHTTAFLK